MSEDVKERMEQIEDETDEERTQRLVQEMRKKLEQHEKSLITK